MNLDTSGPEVRALRITRRWILTMLSCLLVLVALRGAVSHWALLNSVEHLSIVVAVVLALGGAVLGRSPRMLWLADASVLVLALTALFAPLGSPPWLPMPNVASYVAFIAITLTSRRTGLVIAFAGAAFVALIWAHRPTNIVVSALDLWGGWIVVAQILATALATWWAWNTVAREAVTADRDFQRRARAAETAVASQERARVWRSAAARLHESVLNSIRYVLATDAPDRDRLAEQLDAAAMAPELPSSPTEDTISRLIAAVRQDPAAAGIVHATNPDISVHMEPEVFEAARAALVEIAHNAVRHGGATDLQLTFESNRMGELIVTSRDNGIGLPTQIRPGIGVGTVLTESVEAVGGSVALTLGASGGTRAVLMVPVKEGGERFGRLRRVYSPFDKGRLLITAPLAGSFTVGVLYFLLLTPFARSDSEGSADYVLAAIAGILGAAAGVTLVTRRQHPSLLIGLGLIMLPAIVPWALRATDHSCGEAPILAAVVNVAGFAVVTIAAWSGVLPGFAGVVLWATGVVVLESRLPSVCRDGVSLALANSLLVIPVALVGTFVGVRTYQRAADRVNEARRRDLVEQSRAETAIDLNSSLYGAAEEAVALLRSVAAGADLDDDMREELESVDARIRAAIQVDSTRAGGFAVLAKDLVNAASTSGVSVEVRAIGSSRDTRPLPESLENLLASMIIGSRDVQPIIQVFTDGRRDYLSAVVDGHEIALGEVAVGMVAQYEDVEMQVLEEEPDDQTATARFTLLVSRPIRIVAESPA